MTPSQNAQLEKVTAQREALARNVEIQTVFRRRALYGDNNPTRPLSQRELNKLLRRPSRLRRAWNRFTAIF